MEAQLYLIVPILNNFFENNEKSRSLPLMNYVWTFTGRPTMFLHLTASPISHIEKHMDVSWVIGHKHKLFANIFKGFKIFFLY